MNKELNHRLENELPPREINPLAWPNIILALMENRDMVLPLYFKNPYTGRVAGDFFAHLVTEGEDTYLQFQGFNSSYAQRSFLYSSDAMEMVQPGIYRTKFSF